jgi:phosphoribosyl-AMP cyclohydrolase
MRSKETGSALELDFRPTSGGSSRPVVPVVLQDADTGEVLFVAHADAEALAETLRTRTAVLWSLSRDELWRKGATSGDVLDVVDVYVNCEQTSLLYRVRPRAGVCHTRGDDGRPRPTCYYRRLEPDGRTLSFARAATR